MFGEQTEHLYREAVSTIQFYSRCNNMIEVLKNLAQIKFCYKS